MKNLLMILFCVTLGAIGQLTLKHGMNSVGKITQTQVVAKVIGSFSNPYVVAGFILYGLSALVWMIVLSRVEVSWAYPMVSFSYVVVVVASRFLFNEDVDLVRILGTLVICAGVFLVSRS